MNKAIIFDVDGTLSETEETHRKAFNRAFLNAGLSWNWDRDLYSRLLGVTGGKERIRHYLGNHDVDGAPSDDIDEFVRSIHKDKTAIYTDMVTNGEVSLRPGIKELIIDAKANGFRLAIATTTTPANVDALLSATLDIESRNFFEVICAGDSVVNKKPAPDVFIQALKELDLPVEKCVALEDSRNGLLSAHGAGIATVVTPGIYTDSQQFDEAALVIENLSTSDFPRIYALISD